MKKLAALILVTALILGIAFWFATQKPQDDDAAVEAPWHISLHEDGSLEALGIRLGHTTLQDMIDRHGLPDSIALFADARQASSVEAYFRNAKFGPLSISLVLTLDVTRDELDGMLDRSGGQLGTKTGASKFILSEDDQNALLDKTVAYLTAIPAYSSLEADYFRERLGEPNLSLQVSESAQNWVYPKLGLTLLIDEEGKEVFQYRNPGEFTDGAAAPVINTDLSE
ncbi:hypothetical protein Q4485_13650 [Granulosicoccaceae sp. 1_MG-2023]|nr:hypothetical protein [Granulosicoccaceae sp. 1_MG-2023]